MTITPRLRWKRVTAPRAMSAVAGLAAACLVAAPLPSRAANAPSRRPASTSGPARARHGAPTASPLRVLLFGDFGDPTDQQRAVAAAMAREHAARPFDVGFSLGDNVYPCGPDAAVAGAESCRFDAAGNGVDRRAAPIADARFTERYERALAPLTSGPHAIPIHVALGNHDVTSSLRCREGGVSGDDLARRRACLEVAHRAPAWDMPARHYVVDRGPARFVVIDSTLLLGDYGGFSIDGEVSFVAGAVRDAGTRRVFLVAHHPAATAAEHRYDFGSTYLERLGRVIAAGRGRISAWLAGHDHHLQHLRTPAGLDVFVSGNGARARPYETFDVVAPAGAERIFASASWGFAVLEVRASGWSMRFQDEHGNALHCCDAAASGRCDPVTCPVR